jgi:hypothetical protein
MRSWRDRGAEVMWAASVSVATTRALACLRVPLRSSNSVLTRVLLAMWYGSSPPWGWSTYGLPSILEYRPATNDDHACT